MARNPEQQVNLDLIAIYKQILAGTGIDYANVSMLFHAATAPIT